MINKNKNKDERQRIWTMQPVEVALDAPELLAESGLLIEVGIFSRSNVAFLSSLWTKLTEIWYTFNLT